MLSRVGKGGVFMGTTRVGGSTGAPDRTSSATATAVREAEETQAVTEQHPEIESTGGRPAITERDAGIRRAEVQLDGVVQEAHVRGMPIGESSSPQQIAARGQAAGLNTSESQRLRETLDHIPEGQREQEIQFLDRHVLSSPNADRALRTYMDARAQQDHYPERINDDIVHTLTRSVAEPRSGAATEGIMSTSQAQRSMVALSLMPDGDYQRVQSLMSRAGQRDGAPVAGADPQLERGLILESVGARLDRVGEAEHTATPGTAAHPASSMDQIEQYGGSIRGMQRNELIRNSTVMDVDGGTGGLQQQFTTSCAPTSAQITRAEADPIFALEAHQHPEVIESQQRSDLVAAGGVAVPRPGTGGVGMTLPGVLNDRATPFTGEAYARHHAEDNASSRTARLGEMETALERGADVPLRMQWDGDGGHFVVATDVRGAPGHREFLISDPYSGRATWYPESQLAGGHTTFPGTGTGRMTDIYLNE
jgi:hypothetical protein